MKKKFIGFTKIFRFTLTQHCKGRGYRSATITLGILCFLIPFAICTILAAFDSSSAPTPETVVLSTDAQTICVVDDAGLDYDFTTLTPRPIPCFRWHWLQVFFFRCIRQELCPVRRMPKAG